MTHDRGDGTKYGPAITCQRLSIAVTRERLSLTNMVRAPRLRLTYRAMGYFDVSYR
jgi:hypothetical protein